MPKGTEAAIEAGLERALEELSAVAGALNEATDRLNKRILAIEERLGSMGVGATYWLDQHEHHLGVGPWVEAHISGRDGRSRDSWAVGYTKVGSKWCLAVQEVLTQEMRIDGESLKWRPRESFRIGTPITLLSAPRIVRVEAIEEMGALVMGITERAKDLLSSVKE